MSDISSIGHGPSGPLHRPSPYGSEQYNGFTRPSAEPQSRADRVELSEHARLLEQLRQQPAVRTDFVNQIREAIADGSYEHEGKLQIAIERLLDDLTQ